MKLPLEMREMLLSRLGEAMVCILSPVSAHFRDKQCSPSPSLNKCQKNYTPHELKKSSSDATAEDVGMLPAAPARGRFAAAGSSSAAAAAAAAAAGGGAAGAALAPLSSASSPSSSE